MISRMGTCTSRSTWPPNSLTMRWNFLLLLISLSKELFTPLLSYSSKLFNGSKLWNRWWWRCHQVVSNSCNPMDCSHQAPLSMGFSRQEYWSGLPFPSPGDLPDPGIEPASPALQADSLPTELGQKPLNTVLHLNRVECLVCCNRIAFKQIISFQRPQSSSSPRLNSSEAFWNLSPGLCSLIQLLSKLY